MRRVTSIGLFDDAVGKRISITFSEITDEGKIFSENERVDRVITDESALNHASELTKYAQVLIGE